MPRDDFSALSGANAEYIADLYSRYLEDASSVDASWAEVFGALGDGESAVLKEIAGASWGDDQPHGLVALDEFTPVASDQAVAGANGAARALARTAMPTDAAGGPIAAAVASGDVEAARQAALASIRALMLIRAFRVRGHMEAMLDPLELDAKEDHPELDYRTYGFTDDDLDQPIFIDQVLGFERPTLREIIQRLRRTYCGNIGVEFMHIQDPAQKRWIQERIENIENETEFTRAGKRAILERLTQAEGFENFLHVKYPGTKRFGLDGGEALIPALEQVLKRGSQMGLEEAVLGMAHRGRLNVLANFMGKSYTAIFSEFQGQPANPDDVEGSGDVKYHLGTSSDREFDGKLVHLSLTANPSHLEAVNPVVLGKVRAKQRQRQDADRTKVLGILLHGDAAFAGQGLVAETLALSELKGYRTGGTLHFIINNQIGFTTAPKDARSGPHPTDVALMIQAPIFHVNGDDPEATVHVARIATEFRQTFGKDVVVDMVCYRRFGHNEGDEPKFTQPLMYDRIAKHPPTRALYADRLIRGGVLTEQEVDTLTKNFNQQMAEDFEAAEAYRPNKADWLEGKWAGMSTAPSGDRRGKTDVSPELFQEVGKAIITTPEGFDLNSKLQRLFKAKAKMFETGQGIDWATAEALAFGTLLKEGYQVRLSGQDCGRGTFSQRHAALTDQTTGEKFLPLANMDPDQPLCEVIDSPLSEAAVLGFEYGYTLSEPNALVMWEAQFGDFVNGAQIIIDQFITSGEAKWLRMSGLTMLLPHGYEGQGPEHSSARLERFLQACAEDNIQVANCSPPANYFHILRRQIHRQFRKPLIIMTPKSLLRHKRAVSPAEMFTDGQSFHRVLYEDGVDLAPSDQVRRVVLCTGKVYYDLAEERDARGIKDVAILRLEQLYPFPAQTLALELKKFPNAQVIWCQEEPANMGAWTFIDRRLERVLTEMGVVNSRPLYAGRPEAASPATGLLSRHQAQQKKLIDDALTVPTTG